MKKSEPTKAFVIVCIGALIAAYGIGLAIRKIRFAGAQAKAKVVTKSKKPAEEPAKDTVAAEPGTTPETPVQSQDTPSAEEEEERPEPVRERFASRSQEGRLQISEEDMAKLREEMRELMDRRHEMTKEELRKAQAEIHEKYGLPPR
jgi:succinate dehydrogenase/fumarate reductase flavoprotein subunit